MLKTGEDLRISVGTGVVVGLEQIGRSRQPEEPRSPHTLDPDDVGGKSDRPPKLVADTHFLRVPECCPFPIRSVDQLGAETSPYCLSARSLSRVRRHCGRIAVRGDPQATPTCWAIRRTWFGFHFPLVRVVR